MAIGNSILDTGAALEAGLFSGAACDAAAAAAGPVLNPLLALLAIARTALRRRLSDILVADSEARGPASRLLHNSAAWTMNLPATIGDYTDLFAGSVIGAKPRARTSKHSTLASKASYVGDVLGYRAAVALADRRIPGEFGNVTRPG